MNNYAIIILAAGQSKRLGSPKQLVDFKGKTLLNHAIDTAIETGIKNIFVVLGAQFEEIYSTISGKKMKVIVNKNYKKGMASSIRCGITRISHFEPHIEFCILMVCDQPFVTSDLLLNLISEQKKSNLPIVASEYGEVLGTPALFHNSVFDALYELTGDAGAGKLIKQNREQVAVIPFEKGAIDIDSLEDFKFLV